MLLGYDTKSFVNLFYENESCFTEAQRKTRRSSCVEFAEVCLPSKLNNRNPTLRYLTNWGIGISGFFP